MFDLQPSLESEALVLRPLEREDFAGLFKVGGDPRVWEGHPAKNRYLEDEFRAYFNGQLASGGALVFIDRGTGEAIGCSRFYQPPDQPSAIAIGFTFLATAYWGGAVNREIKRLMLGHAFRFVDEVWFHIDPANIRSQKATAKLGAVFSHNAVLDISHTSTNWMCFRLSRAGWAGTAARFRSPITLDRRLALGFIKHGDL